MLILSLESSTSSAKALLFDTEHGLVDSLGCAYGRGELGGETGITDTEAVAMLTFRLGKRLAEGKKVDAVALCGTFHSIAVCSAYLEPSVTYSWNYTAAAEMCEKLREDRENAMDLYRRTGCMPHVTYVRDTLRFLASEGVDLTRSRFLSQGAYNFYRLTGEWAETVSTVSGSGLLNIHMLDYDAGALAHAGVRRDQVGPLVTYRQTGRLSREGAELLGLSEGTPVVPAHPDGAMNQLANGAAVPGRMTLSVGTSGALRVTAGKPVLSDRGAIWCYYGATDWLSGAAVSSACNAINWFKDVYCGGRFSFADLEKEPEDLASLPVTVPFVFGERCPGWGDRKTVRVRGLRPEHDLRDAYYSLRMGVLFNLYQCFEELLRYSDEPKQIILSGGILNSAQWTGMVPDIFGREVIVAPNLNASTLGAAVLGAWAAGAFADVTAYTAEIDAGQVLQPSGERHEVFMELYRKYLELYNET